MFSNAVNCTGEFWYFKSYEEWQEDHWEELYDPNEYQEEEVDDNEE